MQKPRISAAVLVLALAVPGCSLIPRSASAKPRNIDNICSIFAEKRGWRKAARRAAKKHKQQVQVIMAMMHQESSFVADARPARKRTIILGIPTVRRSSAYGYAQAKDETWKWYRDKSGNRRAQRDKFADAIDFIAWYNAVSRRLLGIKKHNAADLYLAYHEGHRGFSERTYNHRSKRWLVDTARRVDKRALRYARQLRGCGG